MLVMQRFGNFKFGSVFFILKPQFQYKFLKKKKNFFFLKKEIAV